MKIVVEYHILVLNLPTILSWFSSIPSPSLPPPSILSSFIPFPSLPFLVCNWSVHGAWCPAGAWCLEGRVAAGAVNRVVKVAQVFGDDRMLIEARTTRATRTTCTIYGTGSLVHFDYPPVSVTHARNRASSCSTCRPARAVHCISPAMLTGASARC